MKTIEDQGFKLPTRPDKYVNGEYNLGLWETLADKQFWGEDVADGAAFALGNYIPAAGIAKLALGTRLATNAAKLGLYADDVAKIGKFGKGIDRVIAGAVMTGAEAIVEASEVSQTMKTKLRKLNEEYIKEGKLDKVVSEHTIKQIAGGKAADSFLLNSAMLAITNQFELSTIFGKVGKGLDNIPVVGELFKEFGYDVTKEGLQYTTNKTARILNALKEAGSETFEETTQSAIQEFLTEKQGLFTTTMSTKDAWNILKQGTDFTNWDKATTRDGLTGAIIGGGMSLVKLYNDRSRDAQRRQMVTDLNKDLKTFNPTNFIVRRSDGEIDLDENNQPKYDFSNVEDLLSKVLTNQTKTDFINQIDRDELKPALQQLAKFKSLSDMYELYAKNGLGDILVDKFKDVNEQQLAELGFKFDANELKVAQDNLKKLHGIFQDSYVHNIQYKSKDPVERARAHEMYSLRKNIAILDEVLAKSKDDFDNTIKSVNKELIKQLSNITDALQENTKSTLIEKATAILPVNVYNRLFKPNEGEKSKDLSTVSSEEIKQKLKSYYTELVTETSSSFLVTQDKGIQDFNKSLVHKNLMDLKASYTKSVKQLVSLQGRKSYESSVPSKLTKETLYDKLESLKNFVEEESLKYDAFTTDANIYNHGMYPILGNKKGKELQDNIDETIQHVKNNDPNEIVGKLGDAIQLKQSLNWIADREQFLESLDEINKLEEEATNMLKQLTPVLGPASDIYTNPDGSINLDFDEYDLYYAVETTIEELEKQKTEIRNKTVAEKDSSDVFNNFIGTPLAVKAAIEADSEYSDLDSLKVAIKQLEELKEITEGDELRTVESLLNFLSDSESDIKKNRENEIALDGRIKEYLKNDLDLSLDNIDGMKGDIFMGVMQAVNDIIPKLQAKLAEIGARDPRLLTDEYLGLTTLMNKLLATRKDVNGVMVVMEHTEALAIIDRMLPLLDSREASTPNSEYSRYIYSKNLFNFSTTHPLYEIAKLRTQLYYYNLFYDIPSQETVTVIADAILAYQAKNNIIPTFEQTLAIIKLYTTILSNDPKPIYLAGPGGSGKSTVAIIVLDILEGLSVSYKATAATVTALNNLNSLGIDNKDTVNIDDVTQSIEQGTFDSNILVVDEIAAVSEMKLVRLVNAVSEHNKVNKKFIKLVGFAGIGQLVTNNESSSRFDIGTITRGIKDDNYHPLNFVQVNPLNITFRTNNPSIIQAAAQYRIATKEQVVDVTTEYDPDKNIGVYNPNAKDSKATILNLINKSKSTHPTRSRVIITANPSNYEAIAGVDILTPIESQSKSWDEVYTDYGYSDNPNTVIANRSIYVAITRAKQLVVATSIPFVSSIAIDLESRTNSINDSKIEVAKIMLEYIKSLASKSTKKPDVNPPSATTSDPSVADPTTVAEEIPEVPNNTSVPEDTESALDDITNVEESETIEDEDPDDIVATDDTPLVIEPGSEEFPYNGYSSAIESNLVNDAGLEAVTGSIPLYIVKYKTIGGEYKYAWVRKTYNIKGEPKQSKFLVEVALLSNDDFKLIDPESVPEVNIGTATAYGGSLKNDRFFNTDLATINSWEAKGLLDVDKSQKMTPRYSKDVSGKSSADLLADMQRIDAGAKYNGVKWFSKKELKNMKGNIQLKSGPHYMEFEFSNGKKIHVALRSVRLDHSNKETELPRIAKLVKFIQNDLVKMFESIDADLGVGLGNSLSQMIQYDETSIALSTWVYQAYNNLKAYNNSKDKAAYIDKYGKFHVNPNGRGLRATVADLVYKITRNEGNKSVMHRADVASVPYEVLAKYEDVINAAFEAYREANLDLNLLRSSNRHAVLGMPLIKPSFSKTGAENKFVLTNSFFYATRLYKQHKVVVTEQVPRMGESVSGVYNSNSRLNKTGTYKKSSRLPHLDPIKLWRDLESGVKIAVPTKRINKDGVITERPANETHVLTATHIQPNLIYITDKKFDSIAKKETTKPVKKTKKQLDLEASIEILKQANTMLEDEGFVSDELKAKFKSSKITIDEIPNELKGAYKELTDDSQDAAGFTDFTPLRNMHVLQSLMDSKEIEKRC